LVGSSLVVLGEIYGEFQRARVAADRICELLRHPIEAAPTVAATPPSATSSANIAFQDVDFYYPSRPDTPALKRFNLKVSSGERIALVGRSGAGKSTIFKLLQGLYLPQGGQILLNGRDLSTLGPSARDWLTIVPQDVVIFTDTVLANIHFARPNASREEVEASARVARIHDFILTLPQGYDTELGPRGVRLSGGQRQRIAIARAALKGSPILLLDEATASLDSASERDVLEALDAVTSGRTTIAIAHRLSTVMNSDRIIVINNGEVVDSGDHSSLLQTSLLYQELSAFQFAST
jgi:ATP-binding cassette subfamily B protein